MVSHVTFKQKNKIASSNPGVVTSAEAIKSYGEKFVLYVFLKLLYYTYFIHMNIKYNILFFLTESGYRSM